MTSAPVNEGTHLAVPNCGLWYPACHPTPGLHWPLRFYPDEVTCPDCKALAP